MYKELLTSIIPIYDLKKKKKKNLSVNLLNWKKASIKNPWLALCFMVEDRMLLD